jgi:glycosyltransferase involved in cell wall biosynthesis
VKVVWAHNFDPEVENAGTFMFTMRRAVQRLGVEPRMVYLGNLRRPRGISRAIAGLREAVRDADIVHAQFGSACALTVSRVGAKKILSLRGSDWYRIQRVGPIADRLHGALATSMTRLSLAKFASVVVMSERMRNDVKERAPSQEVVVVPDGIDLELFKPIDRFDARRALGVEGDHTPWVLFPTLSATNPIKRPWLAEAAVAHARRSLPDIRLRVATGVSHSQMPVLMNAASVVLMTSTHEGWPNSIKEGLACNTPFVSTDVSDLRAIAQVEPSCSVEEPDAAKLGDALVRAIRAPRSETLRDRVAGMDAARCAEKLLSVYRNVLRA